MLPWGEAVTILTPQTRTSYGQQVADWTVPPASRVDVPDVLCEPRPSGEPMQDARNQVTSGWTLYFQTAPATLPGPLNRITVRGKDYDVEGEAADWRQGSFGGVVVQTKRVDG